MAKRSWHLGQTSEHYETGGRGPGSISHTPGDPGGPSYGLSQFALNTGSLREYLDHSRYAASFKELELGSPAFDAKWRELAEADSTGFAQDQHDFTKVQFYDVQNARLKANGLDLSQHGPAVQDALWSTSVQFRSLTSSIFEKGLEEKFGKGYDPSRLTDKDIVSAVQDYKIAHNDHLFRRSSVAVKASVLERAKEEKTDLLNLVDGKALDHAYHGGSGHDASSLGQDTRGPAVSALQADLARLGYTDHRGKMLAADGIFGIDTRHAVERFQHDHHLTVDGKVGPLTQHALHAALQGHSVTPSLEDARHPDHALFKQALIGVRALDAQHGHPTDQHSLNLAAALAVEAKREGLTRIDQAVLGEDGNRIFAVQNPISPRDLPRHASIDTMAAMRTPLTQSAELAEATKSPPVPSASADVSPAPHNHAINL